MKGTTFRARRPAFPNMADLNMTKVMSLSLGRVGLVTSYRRRDGNVSSGFPITSNGYPVDRGSAITKAFAANGAKVYITGRRLDVLEKAAASVMGVSGSIIWSATILSSGYSLLTRTRLEIDQTTKDGQGRHNTCQRNRRPARYRRE
ncbi:uncharacterized protein BT62DRAFT_332633 [Guyanagaster necrorhizus]|uniref:Uncharacterized protein n=1 Tax=Guyanagaster necrorhizus TaxID=856835 RepID=A0A9P8AQ50_9AGAR|nr:uncharacterized protein BT62DRAFT_332633 [Guyanagaster necrorhizus MCA 3950]KAG7443466.1 hypothetical protein BT62DRAFT_332633 [Guyanagaster necrorhizus MCA 3950]